MEAVNHAVLGLLFILCFSLISLEVTVQEMIIEYFIAVFRGLNDSYVPVSAGDVMVMTWQVVMQDCSD